MKTKILTHSNKAPSWPVFEWVTLRCQKCGALISLNDFSSEFHLSFEEAEFHAEGVRYTHPHKCAPSDLQLQTAREQMKAMRKHSKLSFDEEVELYKRLLSSGN